MTDVVVNLSRPHRRAREQFVAVDKATSAGRFFEKLVRNVETDLGGKDRLSRIERELVAAFGGAATTLRYLTHQILLGESSEIDLAGYATMASTMLRIGDRLGLRRVPKDVTPHLHEILDEEEDRDAASRVRHRPRLDRRPVPTANQIRTY
jgi:hypothetical protein